MSLPVFTEDSHVVCNPQQQPIGGFAFPWVTTLYWEYPTSATRWPAQSAPPDAKLGNHGKELGVHPRPVQPEESQVLTDWGTHCFTAT
jgi:hypothetical protein